MPTKPNSKISRDIPLPSSTPLEKMAASEINRNNTMNRIGMLKPVKVPKETSKPGPMSRMLNAAYDAEIQNMRKKVATYDSAKAKSVAKNNLVSSTEQALLNRLKKK